ncbi:MAG: sugar ABC transporter permease [Defluviitaleaceae bacterium]|nr:sugar ABC transporter permease [Defluviitaleaceae bacterium]
MKNKNTKTSVEQTKFQKLIHSENFVGYFFAFPFLIGFLFIMAVPMAMSLYYSFTDLTLGGTATFTGLDNVRRLLNDARFFNSIGVTIRFVVFSVPFRLAFGLFVAYILTRQVRGVAFYRSLYYLPTLIGGSIAVVLVWGQLFAREGVVNVFLQILGLEGVHWFGQLQTAIIPIVLMSVWQFGSSMIIFAAGLKEIPTSYYEAAEIDGANKWQVFYKITLPCLSPVILYNLLMQTIAGFMTFTQAFIMTGGGPADATNFIALYIYNHAFAWRNMGYASLMSWVLLIMITFVTVIIFKTSKKWTFYAND